jgi:glycosyltransferase involved in cell wall biosynthesis
MSFQKNLPENPPENNQECQNFVWLAIDARTAQSSIVSGISRFVIGLTKALADELNKRKSFTFQNKRPLKILIVSKSEPAQWVVELVHKYPDIVSFWSGGPGALRKAYDHPIWLWSTFALKRIQKITQNQIMWLAPANFDRPLFISHNNMATRVIQVVHDSIPFMPLKGVGFLFKRQFKFLVKRALARLPLVTTVSAHSAKILQNLVKKRSQLVRVIGDAVDLHFGSRSKITDKTDLALKRHEFLLSLSCEKDHKKLESLPEQLTHGSWILGIGRNQKYKCWDLGSQAILKVSTESSLNVWFIRIGADQKEISSYIKKCAPKEFGKIKIFENQRIIVFPFLTDQELSEIYRISDLLVHPSMAEGFGLPPLEAALSGTPVIYRASTAIDQHFEQGSLPSHFWHGLESNHPSDWAKQIEIFLQDKKDNEFYQDLNTAESTREFIVKKSKSRSFQWNESASLFLEWLLYEVDLMNNKILKKHALLEEIRKSG